MAGIKCVEVVGVTTEKGTRSPAEWKMKNLTVLIVQLLPLLLLLGECTWGTSENSTVTRLALNTTISQDPSTVTNVSTTMSNGTTSNTMFSSASSQTMPTQNTTAASGNTTQSTPQNTSSTTPLLHSQTSTKPSLSTTSVTNSSSPGTTVTDCSTHSVPIRPLSSASAQLVHGGAVMQVLLCAVLLHQQHYQTVRL